MGPTCKISVIICWSKAVLGREFSRRITCHFIVVFYASCDMSFEKLLLCTWLLLNFAVTRIWILECSKYFWDFLSRKALKGQSFIRIIINSCEKACFVGIQKAQLWKYSIMHIILLWICHSKFQRQLYVIPSIFKDIFFIFVWSVMYIFHVHYTWWSEMVDVLLPGDIFSVHCGHVWSLSNIHCWHCVGLVHMSEVPGLWLHTHVHQGVTTSPNVGVYKYFPMIFPLWSLNCDILSVWGT